MRPRRSGKGAILENKTRTWFWTIMSQPKNIASVNSPIFHKMEELQDKVEYSERSRRWSVQELVKQLADDKMMTSYRMTLLIEHYILTIPSWIHPAFLMIQESRLGDNICCRYDTSLKWYWIIKRWWIIFDQWPYVPRFMPMILPRPIGIHRLCNSLSTKRHIPHDANWILLSGIREMISNGCLPFQLGADWTKRQ